MASKIKSTKRKFILAAALILVIILAILVKEISWPLYIRYVQNDPERTAVAFAKALGRDDFDTLEMLTSDELRWNLPKILDDERGWYRCEINLDFDNYHSPFYLSSWTSPPGFSNGVRVRETFNDGDTIGYDVDYRCGPPGALYTISFWGIEVSLQDEKWVISKEWWLLCNYQSYNGCGP